MRTRIRDAAMVAAGTLGLFVLPAGAQFGFTVVTDPGAYTRMASELQQAIRQYEAIITLYQLSQQAYSNMERAARNITTKAVWMPPASAWTFPTATNTYGTTAGWMQAVNTGSGAAAAWNSAAISLQSYGTLWDSLTAAQRTQFGRRYGSVELTDAVANNAMSQVGQVRGNAAATESAIRRLASDSESNNSDLNTEVGVLNQVSAAGVINARQQQSTNQLLAAIVDQQTVQSKMAHDAMADGIALTVAAQQSAQQNRAAIWGGTTQAHGARLP
jgi:hypothetical protein